MSTARDAADALVAYDPEVSLRLVARIVEELDGEGHLSTREWKVGFARRERMRALGLELAKRL